MDIRDIVIHRLKEIAARTEVEGRHQKCTQCGDCCSTSICTIGELFVGDGFAGQCPLLEEHNNQKLCGAILYSNEIFPGLGTFFFLALGGGLGCCNEEKVGIVNGGIQ